MNSGLRFLSKKVVLYVLLLGIVISVNAEEKKADTDTLVTAMARIGYAYMPSFSPDGKRIAFISNLSGVPQAWIIPSEAGYPVAVTSMNDPVRNVSWSPDGQYLAYAALPGGGLNAQIYITRPDGTATTRITTGGTVNNFFGNFTKDGRFIFTSNARDPAVTDTYVYTQGEAQAHLASQGKGYDHIVDVSRDGRYAMLLRIVSRGNSNLIMVDLKKGTEMVLTPHRGLANYSGKFSPDGKAIYLGTNEGRDRVAFARLSLSAQSKPGKSEMLAARDDAELADFEVNNAGTQIALVWDVHGLNELELFDVATSMRSTLPLPVENIYDLKFSPDDQRLLLSLNGATQPNDIWLCDLSTKQFHQLTFSPHAGIDFNSVVKPELQSYKAHDGLTLSGWLYLPKNFHKPGPIVISFHGGPEGQERPRLRSDYQALVANGIAVFAPNIRGSAGFGKRFVNLDNGAKRFDANRDIKSTADFLVSANIADQHSIGIMGGSYGGYAVMVGLTDYPDTFAAGANMYGIVNFETFFAHTEPWMAAISSVEYGNPKTQVKLLRELSPIHRIDRIIAPTLVMHGANDTNVPVVEAEQVVDNLKRRNIPVEYILFPDEGHGWDKTANRIRSTASLVQFFKRYLKVNGP